MWKPRVGDLVRFTRNEKSREVFMLCRIVMRTKLIPPNHIFAICSSGRRFCDSVSFFLKHTVLVQRLGDVDETWRPGPVKRRH